MVLCLKLKRGPNSSSRILGINWYRYCLAFTDTAQPSCKLSCSLGHENKFHDAIPRPKRHLLLFY